MFRIVSTKPVVALSTIKFLDNLAIPIIVPKIVAKNMPDTVIRSIFAIPICSACSPDSGYVTKPSET